MWHTKKGGDEMKLSTEQKVIPTLLILKGS
jgi:hypothetical protein